MSSTFRRALLGAVAGLLLCGASSAHAAAPPQTGLYEGSLPSGVTAAITVETGPSGPYVSRIGAFCTSQDESGLTTDGYTPGTDQDGNDASYLVESDGLWGFHADDSPLDDQYGGSVDGDKAVVNLSNNSLMVRFCDPNADPEHTGGVHAYPVALTRVGDAPTNVAFGRWTYQEPGGKPGYFYVWGGGAFVGRFDGNSIGDEEPPQCEVTTATLVAGTKLGTGGAFTLPWKKTGLPQYDVQTPTTGKLSGTGGTWTYITDSRYIEASDVSMCPKPQSTTVSVALDTPQKEGAPQPVERPVAPPPPTTPTTPAPAVPGGTAASANCPGGTFKTTAGPFVLCSTAKPSVSGSTATLSGRVTINGFLFLSTPKITVDVSRASIRTSGSADFGVIVKGTDIRLARTQFDVSAANLKSFTLPGLSSKLSLAGLPIDLSRIGGQAPSVSIDVAAGSLSASAGVSYKLASATLAANGSVTFARAGISASLSTKGFSVPLRIGGRQLFELKKLGFTYDQASSSWSVSGGGSISLPASGTITASASGGVRNGRFDSLSLSLAAGGGAGVPGPYGTFFSGGSFDIANAAQGAGSVKVGLGLQGGWPYRVKKAVGIGFTGSGSFDVADLQLELGATANVTAADAQIANGEGKLALDFDDGEFALSSNVNVLDLLHGSTTLSITGDSFLSRGKLSVEFGPSSEPIKYIHDHWPFGFFHDPPDHIGPLLTGDAILSNIGAGARTQVDIWKLHVGATVIKKWGAPLDYDTGFGTTKSIDSLDPTAGRAAQAGSAPGRVDVVAGQQALVLQGSGSPTGQLVVRDPRGRVVVDTARFPGAQAETGGGRVLVARRNGLVGVIVLSPRAGRWRVTPSGAQKPTRVDATQVRPRSGELASVRVRGRRTVRPGSKVSLRIAKPAGTSVELRAARTSGGDDVGVPLTTTTRSSVRVTVPRAYRGTRLRILAVTRRAGVPIGRTRAPQALRVLQPKPSRASRLRVSRGSKSTVVRFRRGGASVRSIVTLTVAGRRYEQLTRGSSASFAVPTRKRRVTVSVSPVRADGRVTKATSKTVR